MENRCCRATAPHAATAGGLIARSVHGQQGRWRPRPGIAAGEHGFDALSQGVVYVAIKAHAEAAMPDREALLGQSVPATTRSICCRKALLMAVQAMRIAKPRPYCAGWRGK